MISRRNFILNDPLLLHGFNARRPFKETMTEHPQPLSCAVVMRNDLVRARFYGLHTIGMHSRCTGHCSVCKVPISSAVSPLTVSPWGTRNGRQVDGYNNTPLYDQSFLTGGFSRLFLPPRLINKSSLDQRSFLPSLSKNRLRNILIETSRV